MDIVLSILLTLLGLREPSTTEALVNGRFGRPKKCVSTIFGMRRDKWAGGNALYLGRPVKPKVDVGIAHRSLPVGSLVLLQNPKKPSRWVVAQVVDRGPYGSYLRDGEVPSDGQVCEDKKLGTWCVKLRKSDPGKWRGCVDTTPKAAKLLGHNGYQNIKYWPIPNTAPNSIWDWPAYKKKGKKKQ